MKTYWKKDDGIKVKKIKGDDIWNLDDTFLMIICESLKYFRANHTGYPPFAKSDEEWNKILDDVVDKFQKVIDSKYSISKENQLDALLHEAFEAFEKVFFALWL